MTMDGVGNLVQVVEPRPAGSTYTTTYTYDVLNHLTGVSMPRDGNTQTRTFNYIDPATSQPGALLRSATNPESGTVSYTYNANRLVATKTDANGNVLTYSYDGYNRLSQVSLGASVLRTYYYDSNPFDGTFSHYALGRLAAIQYAPVLGGNGQFIDMYNYNIPGQVVTKRLQFNQTVQWSTSVPQTPVVEALNLDAGYTYDNEGTMTGISYPATVQASADYYPVQQYVPGPSYTYSLDTMHRAIGMTDQSSATVVSGVQYGAANELLSLSYVGVSESRTYNCGFRRRKSLFRREGNQGTAQATLAAPVWLS